MSLVPGNDPRTTVMQPAAASLETQLGLSPQPHGGVVAPRAVVAPRWFEGPQFLLSAKGADCFMKTPASDPDLLISKQNRHGSGLRGQLTDLPLRQPANSG
jgi:hypothetical protein